MKEEPSFTSCFCVECSTSEYECVFPLFFSSLFFERQRFGIHETDSGMVGKIFVEIFRQTCYLDSAGLLLDFEKTIGFGK